MQHLDAALRALVRSAVPDQVELRHDPPGPDLVEAGEVISLFLHRIEEDVDARAASWTDELDSQGRVIARILPPRRYRCCYLITAWAADRPTEHARLGEILLGMLAHRHLPVDHLPAVLREGPPIELDVAHPKLPGLAADLWSPLGVAPRAGLDVVLSVTFVPDAITPLPAPPSTVDLGVLGEPARPAPVPAPVGPPQRRIRE